MDPTRRSFLHKVGGILGAGILPYFPKSDIFKDQPKNKEKVLVGAHPWIYAAKLPEYDITPVLENIFQDVKYAHYDGVELMHPPLQKSKNVNILKDLIDKYRLPVIGTSYGADMWDIAKHTFILEDVEKILDNLSQIEGRTMGISVGNTENIKTENQLDAQAEILIKIRKMAEERNVVINLHNHTYEVENDVYDLKGTLKRIPDIKLGPDINWLLRAGVDPVGFILEFGDQIVFMHLRDQYQDGRWSESLGEGDTDFAALSKALKKINFQGDLVIELAHENDFEPTRSIRDNLHLSREYVQKVMGY
jgi:sugar phosphate isomerase/epimerase